MDTVAAGVTCTNYGTYLDYNITIIVTGLTGGAKASGITIDTYKRNISGGYMGMSSDFVHSETSVYSQNTVLIWFKLHVNGMTEMVVRFCFQSTLAPPQMGYNSVTEF